MHTIRLEDTFNFDEEDPYPRSTENLVGDYCGDPLLSGASSHTDTS